MSNIFLSGSLKKSMFIFLLILSFSGVAFGEGDQEKPVGPNSLTADYSFSNIINRNNVFYLNTYKGVDEDNRRNCKVTAKYFHLTWGKSTDNDYIPELWIYDKSGTYIVKNNRNKNRDYPSHLEYTSIYNSDRNDNETYDNGRTCSGICIAIYDLLGNNTIPFDLNPNLVGTDSDGVCSFHVKARDKSGNMSNGAKLYFVIDEYVPNVSSITATSIDNNTNIKVDWPGVTDTRFSFNDWTVDASGIMEYKVEFGYNNQDAQFDEDSIILTKTVTGSEITIPSNTFNWNYHRSPVVRITTIDKATNENSTTFQIGDKGVNQIKKDDISFTDIDYGRFFLDIDSSILEDFSGIFEYQYIITTNSNLDEINPDNCSDHLFSYNCSDHPDIDEMHYNSIVINKSSFNWSKNYYLYIRAKDNNNNLGPVSVSIPLTDLGVKSPEIEIYPNSEYELQWDEIDDANNNTIKFDIEIYKKDGTLFEKSNVSIEALKYSISKDLSPSELYYAEIRSVEFIESENRINYSYWISSEDFSGTPTSPIGFNASFEKDLSLENSKYSIKLSIPDIETHSYKIERTSLNSTPVSKTLIYSELANPVDSSFTYIDTDNLVRGESYNYKITPFNIMKVGGTPAIISDIKIENYSLDERIVKGPDNVLTDDNDFLSGIESHTLFTESGILTSNNEFIFGLKETTDYEDDTYAYKIRYKYGENGGIQNLGDGFKSIDQNLTFPELENNTTKIFWQMEIMEYDKAGKEIWSYLLPAENREITYDTTKPSGGFTIDEKIIDGLKITGSNTIKLSNISYSDFSGISSISFENVGSSDSEKVFSNPVNIKDLEWNLGNGPDGNKVVRMTVTDKLGTSDSFEKSIYLDKSSPENIYIIGQKSWYKDKSDNISINAEDHTPFNSLILKINGKDFTSNSPLSAISGLVEGENKIIITAEDNVGNIGSSEEIILKLDTAPPVLSNFRIGGKVSGYINTLNPVVSFSSSDVTSGIKSIQISIDGKEATSIKTGDRITLEEGYRSIKLLIYDNAGNPNEKPLSITVDVKEPDKPEITGHSFIDENTFQVKWNHSDDYAKTDAVIVVNGNKIDVTQNITDIDGQKGINYDISNLAPNTPITLKVTAFDVAGNTSLPSLYTANTKPEEIVYGLPVNGYDPENGHFMKWTVGPGAYESATLKVLEKNVDTGEMVVTETINGSNSVYTHKNLTAHKEYTYRFDSKNGGLNPVTREGEQFSFTLPNNTPEVPVLLFPVTGTVEKDSLILSFSGSEDLDNDPLEYEVEYKKDNGSWIKAEKITENLTSYEYTITNLIHSSSYLWRVAVSDGYTRIYSKERTFTVDGISPYFSVTDNYDTDWTNNGTITYTAKDDDSGVVKTGYELYNEVTKQWDEYLLYDSVAIDSVTCQIVLSESGNYRLKPFVLDDAGNRFSLNEETINLDKSIPVVKTAVPDLSDSTVHYLSPSPSIKLDISGTDDFGEITGIIYGISLLPDVNPVIEHRVGQGNSPMVNGVFSEMGRFLNIPTAEIVNGEEYYFKLKFIDIGGNESEYFTLDKPVMFDLSAPVISDFEVSGFTESGGNNYLSSTSLLVNDLYEAIEDSGTFIDKKEFAFQLSDNGDSYSNLDYSSWTDLKSKTLVSGKSYKIIGRAVNEVGLISYRGTDQFTHDGSDPDFDNGKTVWIPGNRSYVPEEELVFRFSAFDPDSQIDEYKLYINESTDSENILTSLVPGNKDGWIVNKSGNNEVEFRIKIPQIKNGSYIPKIVVTNCSGRQKELTGPEFQIIEIAERVILQDQGSFSSVKDKLTAECSYGGSLSVKGYEFRVKNNSGIIVYPANGSWKKTTGICSASFVFNHGESYTFEARAEYSDGNYSEITISNGVTIDQDYPVISGFTPPAFSRSSGIRFYWDVEDSLSGIRSVQIALGSDIDNRDISKGWIDVSSDSASISKDINYNDLVLETGDNCFPFIRVTDYAGNVREYTGSIIQIDNSAPPVPEVVDQGEYLKAHADQDILFSWICDTEGNPYGDSGSGIKSMEYFLLSDSTDIFSIDDNEWTDSNGKNQIIIGNSSDNHNKTLYLALKSTNGAGAVTYGISNGIQLDGTKPFKPVVTILNGNSDNGSCYITGTDNITLSIKVGDPQSEINSFDYYWGTNETIFTTPDFLQRNKADRIFKPAIDFGPEIKSGEINYFKLTARNEAGIYSDPGYSTGFILDNNFPVLEFLDWGISGDNMAVTWEVDQSKAISPIDYYQVALIPAGMTKPDTDQWVNTGLSRNHLFDISQMNEGIYQFFVKSVNTAGNETIVKYTGDSIVLDRTPPVTDGCHIASVFVDKKIQINNIVAHDSHTGGDDTFNTGISGYMYALGSLADPLLYSGNWVDFTSNHIEIDVSDSLLHGEKVYIYLRSRNGAGLWSEETYKTEPVTIDHKKPEKPLLSNPGYITDLLEIDGILFQSSDDESPLTNYKLALLVDKNNLSLLDTSTSNSIDSFDGSYTGNQVIREGSSYYLAVLVQNAAGLWSEPTISEQSILVDLSPPDPFSIVTTEIGDWLTTATPELKFSTQDSSPQEGVASGITGYKVYIDARDDTPDMELPSDFGDSLDLQGLYTLSEGSHTIYIQVTDKAGHIRESSINLKIDTKMPVPFTINTVTDWSSNNTPLFRFSTTDATSQLNRYDVYIDGVFYESIEAGSFNGDYYIGSPLVDGEHDILVKAIDNGGLSRDANVTVKIDTTPSSLAFDKTGDGEVVNETPYIVGFNLDEDCKVLYSLTDPTGKTVESETSCLAGLNSFSFNGDKMGLYTLTARTLDKAGNPGPAKTQKIRVNDTPVITGLHNYSSTPGTLLHINPISVSDPDGDYPLSYKWEIDGATTVTTDPFIDRVFDQKNKQSNTEYTCLLIVTDSSGKSASQNFTVNINNTTSGTLLTDEYWSGDHNVTGSITVPDGVKLVILPGAKVQFSKNVNLIVQDGGSLEINGTEDSPIVLESGNPNDAWKGIYSIGSTNISHATIKDAIRGLSVNGSESITLENVVFNDNKTGLHLIESSPNITECSFMDNYWYGIHEGKDSSPMVTDCSFSGNGYLYYDFVDTVIDINQLNSHTENSGNRGE